MGQKVNPHGLRVGVIKGWDSKWYAGKDYEKFLLEDIKIREFIKEKLFLSGISKVEIDFHPYCKTWYGNRSSRQQHRTAEIRPEEND